MRLLMVSNMYPSKSYPYYGTFVKNFEKQLIIKGIKIEKSVMKKNNGGNIKKIVNYVIFYIHTFVKVIFASYDLLYVHFVSHSMFPIIVCYYLGLVHKKVILNAHGSDIFPLKKHNRFFGKIVSMSLNVADKIVVPSVYFKNEIIKKYNIPEEKFFISPSGGINPLVFENKYSRKFQGTIHLGFVSRIENGKGWQTFLSTIKNMNLDNIEITIVGNGSEYEKLKGQLLAYNLENKVSLHSLLPQSEVANYFNAFHCFIFPSTRESLGLVGIEAMACGCAVIGGNIGGISTYLKDNENGFLFQTNSDKDLKEKIENYLKLTYKQKEKMSFNATATSKKYTEEDVSKKMIHFLNQIYES